MISEVLRVLIRFDKTFRIHSRVCKCRSKPFGTFTQFVISSAQRCALLDHGVFLRPFRAGKLNAVFFLLVYFFDLIAQLVKRLQSLLTLPLRTVKILLHLVDRFVRFA